MDNINIEVCDVEETQRSFAIRSPRLTQAKLKMESIEKSLVEHSIEEQKEECSKSRHLQTGMHIDIQKGSISPSDDKSRECDRPSAARSEVSNVDKKMINFKKLRKALGLKQEETKDRKKIYEDQEKELWVRR